MIKNFNTRRECPKKTHFRKSCLANLGLRVHGLSLPVKQPIDSGKSHVPSNPVPKKAIEKMRVLGGLPVYISEMYSSHPQVLHVSEGSQDRGGLCN